MPFFRRQLQQIPGFAGGTLEDQILRQGGAVDDDMRRAMGGNQGQALAAPVNTATRPRTTGISTGLTDSGNLDPYNRPVLKNSDGSISTTSSMGVGTDRGETIIPTVVNGVRLSPEQAMAEFKKTGGNFGSYRTVEQGDAAATALHNQQAAYLASNGIGTNGSDTRPRTMRSMVARPSTPNDAQIAAATPRMRDMLTRQQSTPVTAGSNTVDERPLPMREPQPPAGPNFTETLNGEPFGSRPRRTQMRDFVADDAQYLRELEAQPRNWKDKTADFVRALNTNFNGPNQVSTPTKRERNIDTARGTVARDLAIEKSQQQSSLNQLVPVQLDDGTVVMAPARGAGTLRSQQQRIGQADEALDVRRAGLKSQDRRRRAQTAIQIYNSGGANNPQTLAQLSKALELPADLEAKFNSGEVIPQVDAKGDLQLVSKRDGSVVNTGVKSYETTKEAGRNTRQERSANAAMERTKALIAAGIGKLGDPAVTETTAKELEDQADDADDLAKELTERGFPSQGQKAADRAAKLRTTITTLREAANKARTAQGVAGAPSAATGNYAGKRISKAKIPEFAKRHGISEAEALKVLTDGKAIIY